MEFLNALMSSRRWRRLKRLQSADAKILAETEVRAQEILHDAAKNAKKILAQAGAIQVTTARELEADLRADHAQAQKRIDKLLTTLNHQLETIAGATILKLQENTEKLLRDAVHKNEQSILDLQDQLAAITVKERQILTKSLQELRLKKIQTLSTSLQQKIPHIVKQVVGKSLSLTDHEELVRDALEQAAKDISWT